MHIDRHPSPKPQISCLTALHHTYGAFCWFAEVLKADAVSGLDVRGIDFLPLTKSYGKCGGERGTSR